MLQGLGRGGRHGEQHRGFLELCEQRGWIDRFADSELMKEILGEHIHRYLVRNKREEWNAYRTYVSRWETERYLPIL